MEDNSKGLEFHRILIVSIGRNVSSSTSVCILHEGHAWHLEQHEGDRVSGIKMTTVSSSSYPTLNPHTHLLHPPAHCSSSGNPAQGGL